MYIGGYPEDNLKKLLQVFSTQLEARAIPLSFFIFLRKKIWLADKFGKNVQKGWQLV